MSISTTNVLKKLIPLLLIASMGFARQAQNAMTKCFHHRGTLSDKVVCYFAQDPLCTHHPRLSDANTADKKCVRFFLPLTSFASREIKQLAEQVAERNENGYCVKFCQVKQPMHGIQLEVEYNPKTIDFTYARFDAITAAKGLVLTFNHKKIVDEIQRKSDGIARLACNDFKKPRIVIDCGHGGTDAGKVGLFNTLEKDVNLSVGARVAAQLKKKGYTVLCTRSSDIFVPLDERTSFANKHKADLFVSIHSNGSVSQQANGIETYWAPNGLLKPETVAADTPHALFQTHAQHKDTVSELLATHVHSQVMQVAQQQYAAKNRKIKQAVSQVLLGTDMPAVLIELGFLSHSTEARHLANKRYHARLAQGICSGIEHCLTALKRI